MLFYLISLSLSASSIDLLPPFVMDINDNVGNWRFSGKAQVFKEIILLAPPVQNQYGCAWNSAEIPKDDWSFEATFQIQKDPQSTFGGGFAIWLIDNYAAYGNIHGGPSVFKGVCIAATLLHHPQNFTHELLFHVIENQGGENINLSLIEPDYRMPFHHKSKVPVKVEVLNQEIIVSADANLQPKIHEICRKKLKRSLKNAYLGVTAASGKRTSKIFLLDLTFDKDYKTTTRNVYFDAAQHSGTMENLNPSLLRNPALEIMEEEFRNLAKIRDPIHNIKETNPSHVLDIISGLVQASYDVASFRELNDFYYNNILPYSQKFQRRMIKIQESSKQARNVMNAGWNYTNSILNEFNTTLKNSLFKTKAKIISYSEELLGIADDDSPDNNVIRIDISTQDSMSTDVVLSYITMIEIVLLIVVFLYKRSNVKSF